MSSATFNRSVESFLKLDHEQYTRGLFESWVKSQRRDCIVMGASEHGESHPYAQYLMLNQGYLWCRVSSREVEGGFHNINENSDACQDSLYWLECFNKIMYSDFQAKCVLTKKNCVEILSRVEVGKTSEKRGMHV